MDLHSGIPYWPLLNGIMSSYPSLSTDNSCDVAVIGGGITGAIIAWHLSEQGYGVILVDRRHIGMGSTAATTSLLQYELDRPLVSLIKKIGDKSAIRAYCLCEQAVFEIEDICKKAGANSLYISCPSFQFATFQKHKDALYQEWKTRKKAGINVEWFDADEVKHKYAFNKPGGLFSYSGAMLDAYALTHHLLRKGSQRNLQVFDHTTIDQVEYYPRSVKLHTTNNHTIRAGKVIIACGYESEQFLPFKVQQLHSTYAIISEPMQVQPCWYQNSMIWETAEPYLYIRTTPDQRVVIGGKDIPGSDPTKRYRRLPGKVLQLEKSFGRLFPHIPFTTDFAWAGSFATTRDGLPYFGSVAQFPNSFFVLGLGGNGIPFSVIAARLVLNWLRKKKDKDFPLFSFGR